MGNNSQFLSINLFQDAAISASSEGGVKENINDYDYWSRWSSYGSNDTTDETLEYDLGGQTILDRALVLGSNGAEMGCEYYNGSAYVDMVESNSNLELIVNGDFPTDLAGWTQNAGATMVWVDGNIEVTTTAYVGAYQYYYGLVVGETYVAYISGVSGSTRAYIGYAPGNGNYFNDIGVGTNTKYEFVCTNTTLCISLATSASSGTSRWDNVSVKLKKDNEAEPNRMFATSPYFDEVTAEKLKLTISTTQTANSEKYVGEFIGCRKHFEFLLNPDDWQITDKPAEEKLYNKRGLLNLTRKYEPTRSIVISFNHLLSGDDSANVADFERSKASFMLNMCGDRQNDLKGWDWKDIKRVAVVGNVKAKLGKKILASGIKQMLKLEETKK